MSRPSWNTLLLAALLASVPVAAQPPAWGCNRAPATPTGLRSPSQTATSIALAWTAVAPPGGCTVTYRIYQDGLRVATGLTSPATTVTGLTPGTTYAFQVKAVDDAGSSNRSAQFKVATPATTGCALPPAPTGLASPSQTSTSVTLAWATTPAPAGCPLTYIVYNNLTLVQRPAQPSAVLTGLAPGTTYSIRLRAVNATGLSPMAPALLVSTTGGGGGCATPPGAPTGLASPSQTGSSVNLSWKAPTTPAGCSLTYNVYQNGKLVMTVPTTTAIPTGLSAATSYSFTVAAVDAAGASAQSAPLAVTTASGGTPTPAQVLAAVQARMTSATQVNSQPHLNTQTHANLNVYQVAPGMFAYSSSMSIDTDGSDPDPDPDHQGQTTWNTSDGQSLGAHHVPYYVLGDVCYDGNSPCKWFYYAEHNIKGLQFALVFYNGKVIGAVFGDTQGPPGGDARELGEASVQTATLLGIPNSGTSGGVDNGVTYVVFSGPAWVLTGTNATLNGNAQALVAKALSTLASGMGL